MENEIWKDIIGYEGLYQVSNLGRIKSVDRYVKHPIYGLMHIKERILKFGISGNGYLIVGLYRDGKQTPKLVHRLVAEAFIPNPNNLTDVDHLNTNRTDNRVENLRWCTHKENQNNPKSIVHFSECKQGENAPKPMKGKFGKEHNTSKPILQYTIDGQLIREWYCGMDVQRELGINQSNIAKCCRGKYKSSGGYRWKYKGE